MTGNSKDIPSLYKRYLSTVIHVNSWYEDDIFDPETKGYKSIRQVRSMHRRVQQLMNEKFQVKDLHGKEHKWMTQYDVAITQFAFIGLAMIWPHKSAMIAASKEELELINYYWRVLGWFMGMTDEFNACQFDNYDDIKEFNRLIFEHEYKEKFDALPCQKGLEMTQSICLAMHYFTPLITFNSLAHWWSDCFSFNGYELQPLTTKDRLLFMWTKVSFNKFLKSRGFLNFSNALQKKRFNARLQRKDKVYEDLKKKYKDCSHLTYYSDRVDYFNKCPMAPKVEDANNNNNIDDNPAAQKKLTGPLSTNTFKGCPLGYDTLLPELNDNHQESFVAA